MQIHHPCQAVYIFDPRFQAEICAEVGGAQTLCGNMLFADTLKTNVSFALDVWRQPVITEFTSITAAARVLRAAGKYWFLLPYSHIRRAQLILAECRRVPPLTTAFPLLVPLPIINCFTLLGQTTLVYATKRWRQPPLGDYQFSEDKINPPNRAYLKLWEALSLWGDHPQAGDTVVDLGAAPGGWTHVCQALGARVIAVDKAPLAPSVARHATVEFLQQSAFALDPATFAQPVDWLLSDIACYPERAYHLVLRWLNAGKARRIIFTLKLQGTTDLPALAKFQELPGGRVIHLWHNKHEATFFYPAPEHLWI